MIFQWNDCSVYMFIFRIQQLDETEWIIETITTTLVLITATEVYTLKHGYLKLPFSSAGSFIVDSTNQVKCSNTGKVCSGYHLTR